MSYMLAKISPIAFELFGWPVHWYGLIIGIGILVAYILILKEAQRKQIDSDKMSDIVFYTIIIGFIGARLYYVIFKWEYYSQHPEQIISIWQGGIAIYGGILAGLGTICFLSKKFKMNLVDVLDVVAPGVLIAQVIGRWGNFINQEAYGYAVSRQFLERFRLPAWLIDHMYIQGVYHHPTFLYESLWNLIGFLIILLIRNQTRIFRRGEIFATYLMWYGLGRMWIEGLRTDSLYFGSLRVSQWLAVFFVIVSIGWVLWRRRQPMLEYYHKDRL